MADVLSSNLYPPIVDTFMPAFTGNSCRVYFELSDFNTLEDINQNLIQVTVTNQKNNENSLINLNGIRFYTIHYDSSEDKYYIEIQSSHLKEGFVTGQYYKIQIRFTIAGASYTGYSSESDNTNKIPSIEWINTNINSFSEWSSVCLIRRISDPNITTRTFTSIGGTLRYDTRLFKFDGILEFPNPEEGEYLSEYLLTLKKGDTVIEQTPIQFPPLDNNVNRIVYSFKKRLESNTNYTLLIAIATNNDYIKTFTYNFISPTVIGSLSAPIVTTIPDPDQGRIKVTLEAPSGFPSGNYYVAIYRSSHKSNFEDWEEISLVNFYHNRSTTFFDYSIESGVWYKYIGQVFNITSGGYGIESVVSDPVTALFEDVFLNSQGRQLKLQFDSHVTSYKRVITENKTETLGSKFPFVRRNSVTNYKQFQITGLISYLGDDGEIFLTENDIYGHESDSITTLYYNFNKEHRITPYTDYVKEREFREKVFDYLHSGKVFLLRTMTEGLVLVRLMDINLSPKQELNNYIYSFTATAIEIAECNPANYYKYKVFPWYYSTIQLER